MQQENPSCRTQATLRHAAFSPAEGPGGLDLLVAIPALNEEETVARVIRGIPREIPGLETVAAYASGRRGERGGG